jgi:hypothetical protein
MFSEVTNNLTPGEFFCLHVSNARAAVSVEKHLRLLGAGQGKQFTHARRMSQHRWPWRWWQPSSCAAWLARRVNVSLPQAQALIEELPVSVPQRLDQCATTHRILLGLAVALANRPDILLYRTSGLDPLGILTVHEYVEKHCQDLCALHLSLPTVHGDGTPAPRICPPGAKCVGE